MPPRSRAFWLPFGATLIAIACSTEDPSDGDGGITVPESGEEACVDLAKICHGFEDDGPLDDCHELGHAFDGDACKEQYVECRTMCEAAEKPKPPEAGPEEERDAHAEASAPEPDAGGKPDASEPTAPDGGPADAMVSDAAPGTVPEAAPEAAPAPVDSGPSIPDDELCWELSKVCHGLTGDRVEECHTLGHEDDTAVCVENRDCLALCRAEKAAQSE